MSDCPSNPSEEWKQQYAIKHPCVRKKDGKKAAKSRHRKGKCKNCDFCIVCPHPPWCTEADHITGNKRKTGAEVSQTGPTLSLSNLDTESAASPLRRRKNRNKRQDSKASPTGGRVDQFLVNMEVEREEHNSLSFQMKNCLLELEECKTTNGKASKLSDIVIDIVTHITAGNQDDYDDVLQSVAGKLSNDGVSKGVSKLLDNIANLVIDGSTIVRRIVTSLLLSSLTTEESRKLLLNRNYSERRKVQVIENKISVNVGRAERARKSNEIPVLLNPISITQFTSPFSHFPSNANHRENYKAYLAKGKDLPTPSPTTKISVLNMEYVTAWVISSSHYRPGKLRNCDVRGHKLKNLPYMLRYSSVDDLFDSYKKSLANRPVTKAAIGKESFRTIVHALTRTGTFNQGLSYYYVNHIDNMNQVKAGVARLKEITKIDEGEDEGEDVKHARSLIAKLGRQGVLASKFLRHEFYGRIHEESNNTYQSAKFALGAVDLVMQPTPSKDDPLLLVLTLKNLFNKVVDVVLPIVDDTFKEEVQTFRAMADIIHKELMHYMKHILRGWWQERQEGVIKNSLKEKPNTVICVLDHKSKTIPMSKFESMAEYFAKTGMSDLGAMIMWYGHKDGKEGNFIWFYDIIMDNVHSQEARDLMPGFEAMLTELRSEEFKKIYSGGEKYPEEIILFSDNKLCSSAHTPFIELLNSRNLADNIQVTEWNNNEAQR